MSRDGICETCGAKVVEYKHGLSKGLLRTLYKMAVAQQTRSPVSMSEVDLTYSQRCNAQKLRYWRLIVKAGDPESKGGDWYVTDRGRRFLRGEFPLPHYAWTYRAETVRFEGPQKYIDEVTDGWKWRPDYARESLPH